MKHLNIPPEWTNEPLNFPLIALYSFYHGTLQLLEENRANSSETKVKEIAEIDEMEIKQSMEDIAAQLNSNTTTSGTTTAAEFSKLEQAIDLYNATSQESYEPVFVEKPPVKRVKTSDQEVNLAEETPTTVTTLIKTPALQNK